MAHELCAAELGLDAEDVDAQLPQSSDISIAESYRYDVEWPGLLASTLQIVKSPRVLNRKEVDPSWEKKDHAIGMASQVIGQARRLHITRGRGVERVRWRTAGQASSARSMPVVPVVPVWLSNAKLPLPRTWTSAATSRYEAGGDGDDIQDARAQGVSEDSNHAAA